MSDSPLEPLLGEIEHAIDAGFYFLAIAVTLALPDICVSLEESDGRSNGPRYARWCDLNLGDHFNFVTGKDLYSMRCGVVHNGRFGDLKHDVANVRFALPSGMTFVNCQVNDTYIYSVAEFCQNFIAAVRNWFEANKASPIVLGNLPRLFRIHEDGLRPIVAGARAIG